MDLPAPDGPTSATVLPAGDREADVVEHALVGDVRVGERDVLEPDALADGAEHLGARPVDRLRRRVDDLEQPLGARERLVPVVVGDREALEGPEQRRERDEERDEVARLDVPRRRS